MALDQLKIGGDPDRALALAVLALAEAVHDGPDLTEVVTALNYVGTATERAAL
jgi:hypothetical protein